MGCGSSSGVEAGKKAHVANGTGNTTETSAISMPQCGANGEQQASGSFANEESHSFELSGVASSVPAGVLQCLGGVPLFKRLSNTNREIIASAMVQVMFNDGERICQQGVESNNFYVVHSGGANVWVRGEDDMEQQQVATLRQGDYFGETALMSCKPCKATILARGKLVVYSLEKKKFEKVFKKISTTHARREGISELQGMVGGDDAEQQVRSTEKTPVDFKFLIESLQQSTVCDKLDKQQLYKVVEAMWRKRFIANSVLLQTGDTDTNLYVISRGKVLQLRSEKNTAGKITHRLHRTLVGGDRIGELGLFYNQQSQYTFMTKSQCVVWAIGRAEFRRIVKDTTKEKLEEFEKFLATVPLLDPLVARERRKIAGALDEISFPKGHDVVVQGEEGDACFFIRRGQAAVYKRDAVDMEAVEVVRLGPGCFFGERALIKNDVRAATVTVISDELDCVTLDREGFTLLLGPLGDILDRKVSEYDEGSSESHTRSTSATMTAPPLGLMAAVREVRSLSPKMKYTMEDFKVIGTLGKGSFGHVQLVQCKATQEYFALKGLHKQHVVDMGQCAHLVDEKRVLQALRSPFIVKLFATFKDESTIYFLLEPVLGGELFSLLREYNAFQEEAAVFYAGCVVEAFAHMHSKKIIYRDLKPENLLLDNMGYLKVTDFGFAKKVKDRTFTLCGTPDYLAPEVVAGIGHGEAVDWWTLGVLVFEMLASYPPFYDKDPMQTYTKIMKAHVEFPRHFSPEAKSFLNKVLKRKAAKRLGTIKGGVDGIRKHEWFGNSESFSWDKLTAGSLSSPYQPKLNGADDLSNYDDYAGDQEPIVSLSYHDDGSGWDDIF